ncbi:serine/threonine protein kinase [Skermania sp. ID1734]|uniref:serine/threonine-protein kinase n=1 Tax=Skermania sp. ID1734 TaxID=2597516 RepID=UPI00117D3AF3|nr:serine/threonine-protein kinase [Skermania sp. ID1734]TSE00732.1 serine/threonine protein kinase [Skermania sp. ID1734]
MLVPGTIIAGRYRLTELLARGGMADVYIAIDETLRRRVAVKLFRLDPHVGADERRVQSEIRTLAALHHPGLVTVFDAGVTDDIGPFLVMELVDGPTLSRQLAVGPLPADDTMQLGAVLARTLAYVHSNGVIHRDIKPANILLDSTNGMAPKLADFGIARLLDSARLTDQGVTVGTANYLSPEQVRDEPVGPPADIYALGLVLIECVTGQAVYPGGGSEAALARLQRGPAIPAGLPEQLSAVLTMMTRDDPGQRPTAAEVAERLGGASRPIATMVATRPVGATTPPTTVAIPRRPVRLRLLLLAAAVLAMLLIAIVVFAARTGKEKAPAPAVPPTSVVPVSSSLPPPPTSEPAAVLPGTAPVSAGPPISAAPPMSPTPPAHPGKDKNPGHGNPGKGHGHNK